MTPAELKQIRKQSGLTQAAFARALGYTDKATYRKYETALRPIPLLLQKLAWMIERHGLPEEWKALE